MKGTCVAHIGMQIVAPCLEPHRNFSELEAVHTQAPIAHKGGLNIVHARIPKGEELPLLSRMCTMHALQVTPKAKAPHEYPASVLA